MNPTHNKDFMQAYLWTALAALLLFSVGCTTINDQQYASQLSQQWIGKSLNDVIKMDGGTPSRVIQLPDKTYIYVWSTNTSYTSDVSCFESINGMSNCTGGNIYSSSCEISAFVDTHSIVTNVTAKGCSHLTMGKQH